MNKLLTPAAFLCLLGIIVVVIAGHNFERYYLAKDYPLHVFTACDPISHSCFIADEATADPTFQNGPYEKVEIGAAHAPSCLGEHTCSNFSCDGISACSVTYCSESSKEEGETCSNEAP